MCVCVVSLFIVGTMLFSSFVHFFHFYHFPSFIRSISVNTGSNREQITGHYQNPYQNKTSNQFPACLLSDLPLRQCVCLFNSETAKMRNTVCVQPEDRHITNEISLKSQLSLLESRETKQFTNVSYVSLNLSNLSYLKMCLDLLNNQSLQSSQRS